MLNFLGLFISSFSQLLSLPSFALMANKSVHCVTPSFDSYDGIQFRVAGERHSLHVELEPLTRAALLKSSTPKHLTISRSGSNSDCEFIPTPPVPANSPSLTPSSSVRDTSVLHNREDSSIITFSGVDSYYPIPTPSSSIPTIELALMSGSSECLDEEPECFDFPSISSDLAILEPENLPKGVGLGISGLKHDESGYFDGVGLVSFRHWGPRPACVPLKANDIPFRPFPQDAYDEGPDLSDTFLREAEMSFIQDPFHIHSLATIPECQSWTELDLGGGELCESLSIGLKDESGTSHALPVSHKVPNPETAVPLRRMKKHFSASTISSELKRTSSIRRMNPGGTRSRSGTWPVHVLPHRGKRGLERS